MLRVENRHEGWLHRDSAGVRLPSSIVLDRIQFVSEVLVIPSKPTAEEAEEALRSSCGESLWSPAGSALEEVVQPSIMEEAGHVACLDTAAGLTSDSREPDIVMEDLRRLSRLLYENAADELLRAAVREGAITCLKEAGIGSPAKMVDAALRASPAEDDGGRQGQPLLLEDPEPWDLPVDGADLLTDLARTIVRYVVLPEGAATAIALWVVFAYAHDQSVVSPLLSITSPMKRCGKSTLVMLVSALVPRPLPASNITGPALFRAVQALSPTLLIDEADTFLKEREELRGILNSGHTRPLAYVVRCDGEDHEARTFSTWCPKVVALIGRLPDTLADRSIVVSMRRKARGERAERLRLDRLNLDDLWRKAARWVADSVEALQSADPDVPDCLGDRAADNWRPLLAIADRVGAGWQEKARRAAVVLSGAREDDGAVGTLLLCDLKRLFDEQEADRLTSAEIVAALLSMEERPWPEHRRGQPLTQPGLARLLEPFGVKPRPIRIAGESKQKRGYDRAALEDAWTRYLAPEDPPTGECPSNPPAQTVTSVTTRTGTAFQPDLQVSQTDECDTYENAVNPHQDCVVTGVTRATPPSQADGCPARFRQENELASGPDEDGWIVGPAAPSAWDARTAELIAWFSVADFPTEPFDLTPWARVLGAKFFASLRGDVWAGPSGPRARTGALQDDLERLAMLFGPGVQTSDSVNSGGTGL